MCVYEKYSYFFSLHHFSSLIYSYFWWSFQRTDSIYTHVFSFLAASHCPFLSQIPFCSPKSFFDRITVLLDKIFSFLKERAKNILVFCLTTMHLIGFEKDLCTQDLAEFSQTTVLCGSSSFSWRMDRQGCHTMMFDGFKLHTSVFHGIPVALQYHKDKLWHVRQMAMVL